MEIEINKEKIYQNGGVNMKEYLMIYTINARHLVDDNTLCSTICMAKNKKDAYNEIMNRGKNSKGLFRYTIINIIEL